jgi:thymidine kinase
MAKFTFIFSSMNSGKTLALLTKNYMLRHKGAKTLLLKPSMDDRTEAISSRIGIEETCLLVSPDQSISDVLSFEKLKGIEYIFVDESQFLNKHQIWELSDIVDDYNIDVLCYGIKLDWRGDLFEGSLELLKVADELVQMDTYCEKTGNTALWHVKLGGSDSSIETGYEAMYDTVSRKIWKNWFSTKST